MRSKIFLYLFIFSLLGILYLFISSKNIQEYYDGKLENLNAKVEKKQTEVDSLINLNLDLQYFNLQADGEAQSYFEEQGYDALKLAQTIEDQILAQNNPREDNPLIPFEGMAGTFAINKVRLLNHKWIIADFTDGTYWGQLLIVYDVKEDGIIDFEVIKSFLYPVS